MRKYCALHSFTAGSPRSRTEVASSPEHSVIQHIIEDVHVDSDFEEECSDESEDEDVPSTSTSKKRRRPKEKPLPPGLMEKLESEC